MIKIKFIKFEIRQLFKSVWSILFFVSFISIFSIIAIQSKGSTALLLGDMFYIEVFLCVFILTFSLFIAQNINDFEFSLESKRKIYSIKLLSIIIFLLPSLCLLIIYLFLPIHSGTTFDLQLDYLKYILICWLTKIFFLTVLGFFLGRLSEKKIMYVISFFIAIIISPFFQNFVVTYFVGSANKVSNTILNLINISLDEPYKFYTFTYGFTSNRLFFFDIIVYPIIGVILLSLLFFCKTILSKKNIINSSIIIVSLLLICVTINKLIDAYPDIYDSISFIEMPEKYDNTKINKELADIKVFSYKMDVQLKKKFENKCVITLNNDNQKEINSGLELKLDDCFKIHRITIDNVDVSYKRNGEYICIENRPVFSEAQFNIEIDYSGDVNYMNQLYVRNAFVDDVAAYLPETFAWYPKLEVARGNIKYDLTVEAGNNIVSNLSDNKALEGLKKYSLTSQMSSDIYLLCGYFKTETINNVTVTAFSDLINSRKKKIMVVYQDFLNDTFGIASDPLPKPNVEPEEVPTKELSNKSLLFIPFAYNSIGEAYCLDDCMIISETRLFKAD